MTPTRILAGTKPIVSITIDECAGHAVTVVAITNSLGARVA